MSSSLIFSEFLMSSTWVCSVPIFLPAAFGAQQKCVGFSWCIKNISLTCLTFCLDCWNYSWKSKFLQWAVWGLLEIQPLLLYLVVLKERILSCSPHLFPPISWPHQKSQAAVCSCITRCDLMYYCCKLAFWTSVSYLIWLSYPKHWGAMYGVLALVPFSSAKPWTLFLKPLFYNLPVLTWHFRAISFFFWLCMSSSVLATQKSVSAVATGSLHIWSLTGASFTFKFSLI